jgi:hypothetical protein
MQAMQQTRNVAMFDGETVAEVLSVVLDMLG